MLFSDSSTMHSRLYMQVMLLREGYVPSTHVALDARLPCIRIRDVSMSPHDIVIVYQLNIVMTSLVPC